MIRIGMKKENMYIRPELHSHFIEFLGNCIDGGIWVGKDSDIPNYDGIRKDVADAVQRLAPPVIRWPGGCYADMYHWRDGIGKKRRVTWNYNFGTHKAEKNEFGTEEFMRFCERVGARPWLNINMLRGTAAEAAEWAEYCNRREETWLSQERAANGHPDPYHVEYWGIGNEAWGGGGTYTASGYADDYRKFSTAMPVFRGEDPTDRSGETGMKLIAVGPDGNKPEERVRWTKEFFHELCKYRFPRLYGMDLHFYNWNLENAGRSETEFDEDEWYHVIYTALELETVIREQYKLIQEGLADAGPAEDGGLQIPAQCRLIIGEWGNWHGSTFDRTPALYQQCTMRDAVTTAVTLDIFHRNCDKVDMACVAQSVNVLNSVILTDGPRMALTPNYHVFQMYMPHRGGTALELSCDSGYLCGRDGERMENPLVFASEKESVVTISMINIAMDRGVETEIGAEDELEYLEGQVLFAEDPHEYNTPEHPDRVTPRKTEDPKRTGRGTYALSLPAASVSVYQFRRRSTE